MRRLVVVLAGIWAGLVWSHARADICPGAVAVRVNEHGLRFIGTQVKKLIPTRIDVPALSGTVIDWPLTRADATVHASKTTVNLAVHELTLGMSGSALRARIQLDVAGSGPVVVENPYLGLGSANCSANLDLRSLAVDVAIGLSTSSGGVVTGADLSDRVS
jgi:hypothetical protein